MSRIEYKTRGNSSPQGKPRVFVFFHQEDAVEKGSNQSSFDLVCADILAAQNCAIYYESDWTKPTDEEELISLLSEMQLLVMVISTNFLFRNAPQTIRTIYNIAKTNHTPILPIAVEYGIEQVFAEQMNSILSGAGDIQFLDRTANDPTKIPYKEQLEKYLNSVIVGDELASRVRAAFDAYVFMSYRKKDRYYAQQLMRVIHNIPFCRDIAIWYDEYLIPGESWSDAIKEAMAKSSLVTLAVTPSLAEPNYIATHEYPYAKELHKDIIPAEVQKTNRALLERLFKDLPKFVDGTDVNAMTDQLHQLAITTNDESPEHNFLIGLAYLNAIDVERDTQRAFQLIKSSADANLPEAIHKLVDMYNTGEGVQRDYEEAIDWQKKYIAVIEELGYSQQKIVNAYRALGKMEQNVGNLSAAIKYYKIDYDFSKQLMEETNTIDSRRSFAISCSKLGDIFLDKKDILAAKEYYKTDYCISKQLMEETNTVKSRRSFAISCSKLGDVLEAEGNLTKAKEYNKTYHEICKQLMEETNIIDSRREFAVSCCHLGDICKLEGNFAEAKQYYETFYDISKQLMEESNSIKSRREFTVSCSRLGGLLKAEDKPSAAKEYYKTYYDISKQLMEEINTVKSRREFSISCTCLGDLLKAEGNLAEAKEYYQLSYDISKQLMEETNTIDSRREFAISCGRLGNFHRVKNNFAEAKKYYEIFCDISKQIMEETNTIDSRHTFAISCKKFGDLLKKENNLAAAKECYKIYHEICKQLMENTNTIEFREDIITSCSELGDILQAEGNLAEAKEYYQLGYDISKQLMEEINTRSSRIDFFNSMTKLNEIHRAEENLSLKHKLLHFFRATLNLCNKKR